MTRRLRACVELWPECAEGEYNPHCCRFPKSCSCTIYDLELLQPEDLEDAGEPDECPPVEVTPDAEADFEGHPDRECGLHRTTGGRAWCFTCSEWCYPSQPCAGCELPQLRATVERLQARITDLLPVYQRMAES